MGEVVINDRAQRLLKVLVERYIREGQPVGSATLLKDSGLPVSAATVRNIMAQLEDWGLVTSPHTSAGRVPTAQGYRLFVDRLITVRPLETETLRDLQVNLAADKTPAELLASASQLLSSITAQAGLITIPRQNLKSLRQVEFLPLSGNRVLVILVVNEREVQNRVIHTGRPYTEIELQQAANFINQRCGGRTLDAVRRSLLESMRSDKESIDRALQVALDLAEQAFAGEDADGDVVLAGEKRLIDAASPEGLDQLRSLFEAFERKKDILDLVDRCMAVDGVQIFIGEESGYELLGGYSLVTAPYQSKGRSLGVLGVIGPTRMAYESVIPIVDVTARILSFALDPL